MLFVVTWESVLLQSVWLLNVDEFDMIENDALQDDDFSMQTITIPNTKNCNDQ